MTRKAASRNTKAKETVHQLKIHRKIRRKRDGGGAWYADTRLAFTHPFGGRFERVLLANGLSCILISEMYCLCGFGI